MSFLEYSIHNMRKSNDITILISILSFHFLVFPFQHALIQLQQPHTFHSVHIAKPTQEFSHKTMKYCTIISQHPPPSYTQPTHLNVYHIDSTYSTSAQSGLTSICWYSPPMLLKSAYGFLIGLWMREKLLWGQNKFMRWIL